MLAVSDPQRAIEFYERAFGAEVQWQIGEPAEVAGLVIDGAEVFLARESPSNGTRSPDGAGITTVRIELFVDDPQAVQQRATDAGAKPGSAVALRTHETVAGRGPLRMMQGGVVDPFGHVWLIGKFLGDSDG